MGRSAHVPRWRGSDTRSRMLVLGALLAAVALQPTIAVVDTGSNLHAPAISATYDVRTGRRGVRDLSGHGTAVTSLILRSDPGARVLVIRAGSSSGAFSDANEATAIRYAVDHGARIVNLSLGGSTSSTVERAAVRYAIAHGVLLVAAAGDDYAARPEYPAALLGRDGLAVASVLSDGTPAEFSNRGPWVSIAAPGDRGTSFAAPLVAAAAAQVWAVNPRLRAREVASLLESTASLHGARTDALGFGALDVAAAVARAR
jgi:thermitase